MDDTLEFVPREYDVPGIFTNLRRRRDHELVGFVRQILKPNQFPLHDDPRRTHDFDKPPPQVTARRTRYPDFQCEVGAGFHLRGNGPTHFDGRPMACLVGHGSSDSGVLCSLPAGNATKDQAAT